MATKNPRINVVLEEPVYNTVRRLAEEGGLSMSMLIRDMVKDEIEAYEDSYLAGLAKERQKEGKKYLTHRDVWGK